MATSDEQFGPQPPYDHEMTSIPISDLLHLAARAQPPGNLGACLDEVTIAAVADGALTGADLTAAQAHLAACSPCRRQLAALAILMVDPAIAASIPDVRNRSPTARRLVRAAAAVAAIAAALMLVILPLRSPDTTVHRDPVFSASAAPIPLAPLGQVGMVRSFAWSQVDDASSYRVTLFDSAGTVVFEAQVGDTTVAMPDSVRLDPRDAYRWQVEARTGWDRWSRSSLVEFHTTIEPKPQSNLEAPGPPLAASTATRLVLDDLWLRNAQGSDTALAQKSRESPDRLRDAFRTALARAARAAPAVQVAHLRTAQRLAQANQVAWNDDFLLRELTRFTRWSPAQRATKLWVDSVRLAGVGVYGRNGPAAAIAVWRQSLARASTIPDSAGIGAALGNIGAAMAREGQVDAATVQLKQAERVAALTGDIRALANAISELGGLSEATGDLAAARDAYARAVVLRRRVGDARGLAADHNNIASVLRATGDIDGARRQLEAALALNRRDRRPTAAATNLVNLAALAADAGAFGRGDADYREALTIWREHGDTAEAASALSGLGELSLRRGDYPAAIRHFTDAAAILDRTGPLGDALAARHGRASAFAAQGLLQRAIDELGDAQRRGDSLQVAIPLRAGTALARADLAMRMNQHAVAKGLYQSASTLFTRVGQQAGVGAARHGLGLVQLAEGDVPRAAATLRSALQLDVSLRDHRSAATTRLALSEAALRAGNTEAARGHLDAAAAEFTRLGDVVAVAATLSQRADLEVAAGRLTIADSLYRLAGARIAGRSVPDVSWRIHSGQADLYARWGRTADAARELRLSILAIEQIGASLRLGERRSATLADKWTVYHRLALIERNRGRIAESFAASESLRAREMVELLAMGRVDAPRDTAADLVAKEQDLRRRIGELSRTVQTTSPDWQLIRGPDVGQVDAVTRSALLAAQAAYAELKMEIRDRAPRHAALVAGVPAVSWRSIANKLDRDEVMLEYLLTDSAAIVYVITRDTLAAVELPVAHRALAQRVSFAIGALMPRGGVADSAGLAPLRQLHRELISPVRATGLLDGKTRLVIVPHAELHYLPFAALVDERAPSTFLVQRYVVSVAPSASVWVSARGAPSRGGSGILAMGPRLEQLPGSRQELAVIARRGGPGTRVLTGLAASETAFRREAPLRRVIHLATYGVLNKQNPLFSFVDLAEDRANDGRLDVHEVFGLKLVADLVVLSACQTALASGALGDVPAGDDWVGLSRAFLSAGARSVVASLWPVQDQATATLMVQFYSNYVPGADSRVALAAAQRAMLAVPSTAHPYYWAGFEAIGGR